MRRGGAVAVLALSAVYFAVAVLWRRSDVADGIVAYDFYGQFYPWQIHARRALSAGGLLWNPYQDCGQVFLANIQTALLYPPNWVFLLLPREPALIVCVIINLIITGVGMFQLCRTLRMETAAALTAALAFQLGWAATQVASWSPTHAGTFVWIPVAMWRIERIIRVPTVRNGTWLGLILALQILAGFPQIVFLTYQIIAFRVLWALIRREAPALMMLRAAAIGLLLPPAVAAAQLLPSLEAMRDSLWGAPLPAKDLGKPIPVLVGLGYHLSIAANPLSMVMACVAAVTAYRFRWRDAVVFYLFIAGLFFFLHLGPGTVLFDLYTRMPLTGAFRAPARLLWITNFGVAVLAGFAAEAILSSSRNSTPAGDARARLLCAAVIVASAAAVQALSVRGFSIADSGLALLFAGLVALTPLRPILPLALPALAVLNVVIAGQPPVFTLRSGDVYNQHAAFFAELKQRMTAQDRMLIIGAHPDLGIMPKSGTVFALPNVQDYDPMVLRAYAEFFTYLRTGRPYRELDDWYWLFGKLMGPKLSRPLFDLTAARYLLVDHRLDDRLPPALTKHLTVVKENSAVRLYEYRAALDRARYVAQLAVLKADDILPRLADGSIDSRTTAVADRMPASGSTGSMPARAGTVRFVADEPERVALSVDAPAPGFVFLADTWAPGWRVEVNGKRQEILRANHTFRLIEVPAGTSDVVFTYAPNSVRAGVLITALSLLLVGWLLARDGAGHA